MTFNVLGAVLLISGTVIWGLGGVYRLRTRVRVLSELSGAMGVLNSEICERLTPMPELLTLMSQSVDAPANALFLNASEHMTNVGARPFSMIWRYAVDNTEELLLTEPERQALKELGSSLGKYDITEQHEAIIYTRRRLEGFLRKAEAERDAKSKVNAFLGFAAGVFAVVILI